MVMTLTILMGICWYIHGLATTLFIVLWIQRNKGTSAIILDSADITICLLFGIGGLLVIPCFVAVFLILVLTGVLLFLYYCVKDNVWLNKFVKRYSNVELHIELTRST